MNLFRMLVMAFRAAVRSEVERAMADRRAALNHNPMTQAEAEKLSAFLRSKGVTVRGADIIPFPANDTQNTSPLPPSVA